MEMRRYWKVACLIVLGMALLFVDFLSKAYVYHVLPFYDVCEGVSCVDIPIFSDFFGIDFKISLAVNTGAAWGMFADFQIPLVILRICVIVGIFLYLFFWNRNPFVTIPMTFILAGALGNLIDFFLYKHVIDFLHFTFWGYHFPIFNFADSCITIGVITLIVLAPMTRKRLNSPKTAQ